MIDKNLKLQRVVMEVFGGCNYTCQMCPQTHPGRGKNFTRKMPISEFKKILDSIIPKYGKPIINLEGSGEPTMAKDLAEYIKVVRSKDLKSFMYCNGARLNGKYMQDVIDAGIDFIRFSLIGYNREMYKKWMNVDNFNLIISNILETKKYIQESDSNCVLSTYHLVTNNSEIDYEVKQYKNNITNIIGIHSYIWKMHNWSGNYDNSKNSRNMINKRSCGRPFAPELTVRAGGAPGRTGAIVPCCQTMGPPNELKSVLGHLDNQTFEEIYFGEKYEELRDAHKKEEFERIEYCKNCDFLDGDPEVLVWSNDKSARVNHMLGTDDDFTLTDPKFV